MIFRNKILWSGFLIMVCGSAWGHSGGKDANGCHLNHSTGNYHCVHPEVPPPPTTDAGGNVEHRLSVYSVTPLEAGETVQTKEEYIGQEHSNGTAQQPVGETIENKGCMAANYDVKKGVLRIPQLYVVDGDTNSWQNVTMEGAQFTGKGVTFSTFSIK